MKFRPEANIFPMMPVDELKEMAADIDKYGQRETIKTYKGDILDGRNRWTAISEHCDIVTEFEYEEVNPESPTGYVLSENMKRRHLTPSQKAMAGAEALPLFEAEADARRRAGQSLGGKGGKKSVADRPQSNGHKARDDAAKATGAAPRTVQRAKYVIDNGSAKLSNAVKDGALSVDRAEKIAKKTSSKKEQDALLKSTMESKQSTRVKGLTGEVEWYTPIIYIEAARSVMGSIDLDPATSKAAQKYVNATNFYTIDDDGLTHTWGGNVFLNPPYAMPMIKDFATKIAESYQSKDIPQGILLTNNATDTAWFHIVYNAASASCFTKGRIKFIQVRDGEAEEKASPTNGQFFFYFGNKVKTFIKVFSEFGSIAVKPS